MMRTLSILGAFLGVFIVCAFIVMFIADNTISARRIARRAMAQRLPLKHGKKGDNKNAGRITINDAPQRIPTGVPRQYS
jgi:hypothetical protein